MKQQLGDFCPTLIIANKIRGFSDNRQKTVKLMYKEVGRKKRAIYRSGERIISSGRVLDLSALLPIVYTQRDWAIFTQTYGQPVRVGKWGAGASDKEKNTLFRAVANIAGDMAAIIPDTMQIEFVESGNIGTAAGNYKDRADWLDQQVSKAVLGQTATTDAVTGGLGSGKEHRQVQEDIERSDARALAAILNRDLIIPWMQLNFGKLARYPRLKIERAEQEDLKAFTEAIAPLVDRGLPVSQKAIYARFNLPEPAPDETLLQPVSPKKVAADTASPFAAAPDDEIKRFSREIKRGDGVLRGNVANRALMASGGDFSEGDLNTQAGDILGDQLSDATSPAMAVMMEQIEAMINSATSMSELREMLRAAYPEINTTDLGRIIAQAMLASNLAGRVAAGEE